MAKRQSKPARGSAATPASEAEGSSKKGSRRGVAVPAEPAPPPAAAEDPVPEPVAAVATAPPDPEPVAAPATSAAPGNGSAVLDATLREREAELAERERGLDLREKALRLLERTLADQDDAVREARQKLISLEKSLGEREDDLCIREAALDEAMLLATEMGPEKPGAIEGIADGSGDLLEGPPDAMEAFLEGPSPLAEPLPSVAPQDKSAPMEQKVPLAVPPPATSEQDVARRAEEAKKLQAEAEALLALVGDLSFLEFIEPRVKRQLNEKTLDAASMVGYYGLVARLLKEELDKTRQFFSRQEHDMALELRDKDKALLEANATVTGLQEDFERYRNRAKVEQEGMSLRANEDLLRRIVPIADNFARALSASANVTNVEAVLSGVQMIYRMFDDILSQEGLVPIKATRGTPFDPKVHEALMEVETDEFPEDSIYDEVQRGYYLAGKVFRPGLVKVTRPSRGGAYFSPAPEA